MSVEKRALLKLSKQYNRYQALLKKYTQLNDHFPIHLDQGKAGFFIVGYLAQNPDASAVAIKQATSTKVADFDTTLTELITRDLVSENDGKYRLTKQGLELRDGLEARRDRIASEAFQGLNEAEQAQFYHLMSKLVAEYASRDIDYDQVEKA